MTIISGGQTGIDRMGLEVARELGLKTGGMAPRGYRTENGPDLSLKELGLLEWITDDYASRTRQNILDSDGTVLYGNSNSPGSKLTVSICHVLGAPLIINPSPVLLAQFISREYIRVLNVAGNRASKISPDQLEMYRIWFREGLLLR